MPDFCIPIRYIRLYPDEGQEFTETNFHYQEAQLAVDYCEIALVMVDVWNCAWGPKPLLPDAGFFGEYNGGMSFPQRAKQIILEKIKPGLEAARSVGITVVHMPTDFIARRYLQCQATLTEADKAVGMFLVDVHSSPELSDWPPPDFVKTWNGERLARTRNSDWLKAYREVKKVMDIPDEVKPINSDLVIATGDQMHRLMKERGVKYLFYCGFATNWCVMDKPGGIHDMAGRGYGCILLRDATTALEHNQTVGDLLITKAFVDQVEMRFGYSALTKDFIKACRLG